MTPIDYATIKRVPNGHWNIFQNHITFRNYIAAILCLLTPEDWYRVSTDQIRELGGSGLLNSKYKGQTLAFLKAVFPDVTWYPWLFKTPLKKIYDDVDTCKLYLSWLADRLGWTTREDYYKMTTTILGDNCGGGILSYYKSRTTLLNMLIPPPEGDEEWYEWKFSSTSNNYWDSVENRRKYADWLYKRLGFTKMEDWYTVTQDTFREHCGCGLILNQRTFGSSHIAFLKQVYPDYTFYEWLFSQPTQGFWEEVENRLSFMKWFGEIMGCVTVDDWYRITGEDIGRCSGGGLKAHYYQDSQSRMIIELNPHLSFDESKFLIHKTIAKLCAFLKQHNIRYEREYKIHPGRKNGAYRADIYLPDLRICIELDGPQHFRQVSNWRLNPLLQATRDVFKMQRMEEKGMRCIRVLQEEVLQHPDSWLDANLIPLLCVSEDKDPVYIVTLLKNKGMYDKHKELYTTQIDTAAMYDD